MKKKLLSLVVGGMLFVPSLSFAIGLGSVRTYSDLNEQLSAEIPVLSIRKQGKMSVRLAPNKMFTQRGIARSGALGNLRFSLVKRNGRTYVRLSSSKKIDTPYLNFILELKSPEGTVYREYAIFLDPAKPGAKKRKAPPIQTASSARQSAVRTGSGLSLTKGKSGRYGPVKRGETLWSIAKKTRPSEKIPVRQMLTAIKRANPRTLAHGLQAGSIIRIPAIQGHTPYTGKKLPRRTQIEKPIKKKPATDSTSIDKVVTSIHLDNKKKAEIKPTTESKPAVILPAQQEELVATEVPTDTETKAEQIVDEITEIITTTPTEELDSAAETDSTAVAGDENTEINIEVTEVIDTATTDTKATTDELGKATETQEESTTKTATVAEPAEKPVAEPQPTAEKTPVTPTASVATADTPVVAESGGLIDNLPVPLIAGLGALVAGVGGLAYFRKRRKDKQSSNVILLGDEDDLQEATAPDTDEIDNTIAETDIIDETVAAIESQETPGDTEDITELETSLAFDTGDTDSTFADDDIMAEFDLEADFSDFDSELDLTDATQTSDINEEIALEESKKARTQDNLSIEVNREEDLAISEFDDLDTHGIDLDETVAEFDIESNDIDFDFEDSLAELDGLQKAADKKTQNEDSQALEFTITEDTLSDSDKLTSSTLTSSTPIDDSTQDVLAEFDLDSSAEDDADFEATLADLDGLSSIDLASGDEDHPENVVISNLTDAVVELDNKQSDEIDVDIFADFDESVFESDGGEETIDFDLDEPEKSDTVTANKEVENAKTKVAQSVASDLGEKAKDLAESVATSGLALTGKTAALPDEKPDITGIDENHDSPQELTEEHIADIKMKLDLATTFMSLPNYARAKQLLTEVVRDGSDEQIEKAKTLLKQIS